MPRAICLLRLVRRGGLATFQHVLGGWGAIALADGGSGLAGNRGVVGEIWPQVEEGVEDPQEV